MIKEDYVSFEVAKLLKEKGFDEGCPIKYKYVKEFDRYIQTDEYVDYYFKKYYYPCPTLQMVMKWLRQEHDLHIDIFVTYKDGIPHYQWSVDNLKTQDTISETPCCNAYEEACEEAIKYCLKNLI